MKHVALITHMLNAGPARAGGEDYRQRKQDRDATPAATRKLPIHPFAELAPKLSEIDYEAHRLGRPYTEEFEHDVCRALLNARKHGDLRRDPS